MAGDVGIDDCNSESGKNYVDDLDMYSITRAKTPQYKFNCSADLLGNHNVKDDRNI